eukprot:TRINITY_DN5557_c0_g2_i2.p1 TRINITY_DN5557_c0_g2~~TRINITY_DN5557_c0_g2_i2.p1  ORF type:complete len:514 (+),score=63.53 TRINITY_DN5557_c0_g2_i2:89-1630(+)
MRSSRGKVSENQALLIHGVCTAMESKDDSPSLDASLRRSVEQYIYNSECSRALKLCASGLEENMTRKACYLATIQDDRLMLCEIIQFWDKCRNVTSLINGFVRGSGHPCHYDVLYLSRTARIKFRQIVIRNKDLHSRLRDGVIHLANMTICNNNNSQTACSDAEENDHLLLASIMSMYVDVSLSNQQICTVEFEPSFLMAVGHYYREQFLKVSSSPSISLGPSRFSDGMMPYATRAFLQTMMESCVPWVYTLPYDVMYFLFLTYCSSSSSPWHSNKELDVLFRVCHTWRTVVKRISHHHHIQQKQIAMQHQKHEEEQQQLQQQQRQQQQQPPQQHHQQQQQQLEQQLDHVLLLLGYDQHQLHLHQGPHGHLELNQPEELELFLHPLVLPVVPNAAGDAAVSDLFEPGPEGGTFLKDCGRKVQVATYGNRHSIYLYVLLLLMLLWRLLLLLLPQPLLLSLLLLQLLLLFLMFLVLHCYLFLLNMMMMTNPLNDCPPCVAYPEQHIQLLIGIPWR